MSYLVVACYSFTPLPNPQEIIQQLKKFLCNREVTGRIYISEEGMNCQMSGVEEDARAFMDYLAAHPLLAPRHFNIDRHHENAFPRLTIKYRPQLVALDKKVDISKTGTHLPPKQFREMVENGEDQLLLDVRNDYEWKMGHFEGAELPNLTQFRDFTQYAQELGQRVDKEKTKVLMYCTGGIRCEIYSALLKDLGFSNVYQLEGGVIRYGKEEGTALWKGKLFVFDDRLAVDIGEEASPPITHCKECHGATDCYFNCANMDCNAFFLSCEPCLHTFQGCCSQSCAEEGRVRPYRRRGNKPFRRKHLVEPTVNH